MRRRAIGWRKLEKELAELEDESNALTAAWQAEKEQVQETQKLKERLDQARSEVEIAQRRGDLARASELLYGVIPDIEKKLAAASDGKLVNEAVTEEQIAGGGLALDRHSGRQDDGRRARQAAAHGRRSCASASSARRRR